MAGNGRNELHLRGTARTGRCEKKDTNLIEREAEAVSRKYSSSKSDRTELQLESIQYAIRPSGLISKALNVHWSTDNLSTVRFEFRG